ncbi:MAG: VWA domain-containing protein [Stappiaceae bacterium]
MMTGHASANPEAIVTRQLVGFIDHLRGNDFAVGPKEAQDSLAVLEAIGPCPSRRAAQALRPLLACCQHDWERFDALFEAYWFTSGTVRQSLKPESQAQNTPGTRPNIWSKHLGEQTGPPLEGPQAGSSAGASSDNEAQTPVLASDETPLRAADLRALVTPEEMAAAEKVAFKLARALRYRLSRRFRNKASGRRLNLRRTIRASVSKGGSPATLVYRARHNEPVRIVVLLDVSGSMKSYARFYLQFVRGLLGTWIEADAYLFHTRLVRVTDALREHDTMKAMTRLALMAEGFGGGTKLAECLTTFNKHHAKRALNSRSVVIILSDGYDKDEPEHLAKALARLKTRVRRLVWLNPMLGWDDYEPVTRSMKAAMPYIDHFAEANTLDSLAAIEPDLARL